MKKAFVLGNGTSRHGFNLSKLYDKGIVYGCNALYRDFTPDVLIAVNNLMAREIEDSGYAKKNILYTREPVSGTGSQKIMYDWKWSSGPVAISYACEEENDVVFLLGFDFQGTEGKINDVYAGTQNYKPVGSTETPYGSWVEQVCELLQRHPGIEFVRVYKGDNFVPEGLKGYENLRFMDYKQFEQELNDTYYFLCGGAGLCVRALDLQEVVLKFQMYQKEMVESGKWENGWSDSVLSDENNWLKMEVVE
tara:strand:- start:548 stop:1297 length:750 start_codon:yes stop_codon:yes gene_type:complete